MKNQQPKPKKVPVYRVKQVSDSLKYKAASKTQAAYNTVLSKGASRATSSLMQEASNDKSRAARLDSLVKKATAPKVIKKAPLKKK